MAQTYKMNHNPQGTIYSLLTVESDGQMTMTFHGTDREICHEVTENADGWLCYPGGMFPGLASGKWNMMEDGRGLTADVVETTENHAEAEECESPIADETIPSQQKMNPQTEVTESPIADEPIPSQQQMNPQTEVTESPIADEPIPNQPRPRRQRKPRKPRVERQEPLTIDHSPLTIDHQTSDISRQTSSTMKAIGMVAAATVALFVIYETGLLIPLGLIGLATGGILK